MESVGEYEYNAKDLIGNGAFALVFKGRHKKNHDHVVAIKSVAKKNIGKSQQFLGKEIKILQEVTKLHHKNVVALLECVESPQRLFIVIEYCNGGDLAEYLHLKKCLSEDTIRLFLRQIAEAMKVLNQKEVVHRDLKPQNILLCHSGKPNPPPSEITLKIADFGFARFLRDGVMAATLCGSPMYMAPEVIMSLKYDAKADLWSIGTIVYQCLTGGSPFVAHTPAQLKTVYESNPTLTPPVPPGTSQELSDLLHGLIKKDPKDRMEFDEFFNHPFLKVERPRSSSPVPVPSRRSLSPEAVSPTSPPCDSASGQCWRDVGGEDMAPCSPLSSSPLQNSKLFCSRQQDLPPSPVEQDFVVVLPNFLDDHKSYEQNINGSPKRQLNDSTGSPSKIPVSNSSFKKSGYGTNINLTAKAVSYQTMKTSSKESFQHASVPVNMPPTSTTTTMPAAHTVSYSKSNAVPVPTQRAAFVQIEQSLQNTPPSTPPDDFDLTKKMVSPGTSPTSPRNPIILPSESTPLRRNSSNSSGSDVCRVTDISSFTPPPVQFTIGTPPSGGRLRNYSGGTPPAGSGRQTPTNWRYQTSQPPSSVSSSPLRRSGTTPPINNGFPPCSTSSSLSPVLGSPSKGMQRTHYCTEPSFGAMRTLDFRNVNSPHCPLKMAFGGRTMTLPEFNSKELPGGNSQETQDQECLLQRSGSSGRLNEQGIHSYCPFAGISQSPPPTSLMTYNYHHCHYNQHSCFHHHCWNCGQSSPVRMRRNSSGCCMCMDSSPTNNMYHYGNSPQILEEHFITPELPEETLLEKEHNETLAKLNFVSALVRCILELAKNSHSQLSAGLTGSISRTENTDQMMSAGYLKAIQLLLYMKALQLLSASLKLSQQEVQSGNLQPSTSVRNVLQIMKEHYHYCLQKCKKLNTPGLLQSAGVDPNSSDITADKIIYNYAIEMCQSAALEELFGQQTESFRRYQTAQILLHSLSHEVNDAKDKELLHKYRVAVERRLKVLSYYGGGVAYETP